jgi:CHAD domain-containing protein
MAEQLETEFTFEPGPDPALPDLSDIAGVATVTKPRVQRLEAVYFDTDDLRLMRAGVTLRRRTGGDDAGWHLKVPAADDTGRTEVHAPLGRSTRQPPQRLRSAATAWTRDASLIPVATVHTRRLFRRLRDERRALVAEVCEDTVRGTRLLEGLDSETTWTEWELELGDAATGDVTDALVARLTEASGRPTTGSSKLRRTLGSAIAPVPTVDVSAESPARDVVRARIAQQLQALRIHDSEVRRDVGDGVHKARVAMRRLRSALATFRPWLDRELTDRLRDDLRWAGRALSPVRDAEVMAERFEAALAGQPRDLVVGPVRRDLDAACRQARREARSRALAAMESARYLRVLARLDGLVDGSWGWAEDAPGRKRLRKRTEREWKRVRGRHDDAAGAAEESEDGRPPATALHAVRKAVKRLRYAAEAVEPVFGTSASELAAHAEEIQTVLGEHQDSVVAQSLLRDLARRADQRDVSTFSYGRLHGLEDLATDQATREFTASWQRLEKLDPRSVLR